MDPVAIAFAISVPAAFLAGVIAHKYVISEANSIKQHTTDEIAELRADVASLLKKSSGEVSLVENEIKKL